MCQAKNREVIHREHAGSAFVRPCPLPSYSDSPLICARSADDLVSLDAKLFVALGLVENVSSRPGDGRVGSSPMAWLMLSLSCGLAFPPPTPSLTRLIHALAAAESPFFALSLRALTMLLKWRSSLAQNCSRVRTVRLTRVCLLFCTSFALDSLVFCSVEISFKTASVPIMQKLYSRCFQTVRGFQQKSA